MNAQYYYKLAELKIKWLPKPKDASTRAKSIAENADAAG
jgi:hypothetical protein